MRCPKCGLEINPLSERCTNCGTSAKLAVPDGDTMTRVRRQIAVVRREREETGVDYADTSFSPVMKFEKPSEPESAGQEPDNPAAHFASESFQPVDLTALMKRREEDEGDARHREIAAEIRSMVRNKEDDLLAEYYFRDGISDLERYELARSYAEMKKQQPSDAKDDAADDDQPPREEEMSEAAKRLNTFPDESGIDKVLTKFFEMTDALGFRVRNLWKKGVTDHLRRAYRALDRKTAPFLNRLLERFYDVRFGKLRRQRGEDADEKRRARKTVWTVCFVLAAALLCVGIFITTLFTDSITGKWMISYDISDRPNVVMEFKPFGNAVISVKSEDGWHVHKQGRYKTRRQNGHDLLTITYEDGSVSRLYYVIEGRSGKFINVETDVEVVYYQK